MQRKRAAILIVVLLATGTLVLITVYPLGSSFHFEEEVPEDLQTPFELKLLLFRSCDIVITFSNEISLVYELDVHLNGLNFIDSILRIEQDADSVMITALYGSSQAVDNLTIVLNSKISYDIIIMEGRNLHTTVSYSNNVTLTAALFTYDRTSGTIAFNLDEDVAFGPTDSFEVEIGLSGEYWPSNVDINIDLPRGLDGEIAIRADTLNANNIAGWVLLGAGSGRYWYGSGSDIPMVDLDIRADVVNLSLTF